MRLISWLRLKSHFFLSLETSSKYSTPAKGNDEEMGIVFFTIRNFNFSDDGALKNVISNIS